MSGGGAGAPAVAEEPLNRRVALMRAEDDAAATAAALAALGFDSAIAPAIEIRALATPLPGGPFDALVATSPRAIRALGRGDRERLAATPLHVVGRRTSEAAVAAGLALASDPAADAATLAARLALRLPSGARLLYLAGRDRKPPLEAALAEAGFSVAAVELYVAEARAAWSAREARAIAGCDAALHFSRRTAALALVLAAQAGLAPRFRALAHVCLSSDVAAPLLADGAGHVVCAEAANQSSLFAALRRMFPSAPKG